MNANKQNEENNPTTETTENTDADDWNYKDEIKDLSMTVDETEKVNKEDDIVILREKAEELNKKVVLGNEEKANMSRYT